VDHFQIERTAIASGTYQAIGMSTTNAYSDATAAAGVAYLYRVKAVDVAGNMSNPSNTDLATTVMFADDPLPSASQVPPSQLVTVKATHVNELRQAIDAVRSLAGLATGGWAEAIVGCTTTPCTGNTTIKSAHIMELRARVDEARTALGFSVGSYTDPGPVGSPYASNTLVGIVVKSDHIQQVRNLVK
jgi:hypothetical protein